MFSYSHGGYGSDYCEFVIIKIIYMKKETILSVGAIVVIVLAIIFYISAVDKTNQSNQEVAQTGAVDNRTLIAKVHYSCDKGKIIDTVYYKEANVNVPSPKDIAQNGGSVDVAIDGGAMMSLNQTISGSGIRYANQDESFIFWSKGEEALIMRNNSMDPNYTNCKVVK
jgi:membrane-bound inhibitor of C-type lysozyme